MRYQSVFRMNRFPLQTSYFSGLSYTHRPCLASSKFAPIQQPHHVHCFRSTLLRSLPSRVIFFSPSPCLVILLLLSMQDGSIAPPFIFLNETDFFFLFVCLFHNLLPY